MRYRGRKHELHSVHWASLTFTHRQLSNSNVWMLKIWVSNRMRVFWIIQEQCRQFNSNKERRFAVTDSQQHKGVWSWKTVLYGVKHLGFFETLYILERGQRRSKNNELANDFCYDLWGRNKRDSDFGKSNKKRSAKFANRLVAIQNSLSRHSILILTKVRLTTTRVLWFLVKTSVDGFWWKTDRKIVATPETKSNSFHSQTT